MQRFLPDLADDNKVARQLQNMLLCVEFMQQWTAREPSMRSKFQFWMDAESAEAMLEKYRDELAAEGFTLSYDSKTELLALKETEIN